MVKVCICGYGGIARTHKEAYDSLRPLGKVRLVGAYDPDPARFTGSSRPGGGDADVGSLDFNCYTDLDEMLEREQPDTVDVCTPTPDHARRAIELLERGFNVESEKPMALTYDDCRRMLEAAEKSGKHLMIGHCLHFSDHYEYLKKAVDEGTFGRVLSACFHRISAPPRRSWSDWFMDYASSGGCMTDLHIHDVDMAGWLFGMPEAVSCLTQDSVSRYDTCFTTLRYADFPVSIIGDWSLKGMPYDSGYRVGFEKAVLVSGKDGVVHVYPADGSAPYDLEPSGRSLFEKQFEYFAEVVSGEHGNTVSRPEDAANTIRIIEHLRRSAERAGETVTLQDV